MARIITMKYRGESRSLDIDDMYMSEEEQLEKYTGWLADEWKSEWSRAHPTAWRFGWWLAGRRSGVDEKFGDVDLNWRELDVDVVTDDAEAAAPAEDGRPVPTGPLADPVSGTDDLRSELTSL